MSRPTLIWIALIATLACIGGFAALDVPASAMSELAATGIAQKNASHLKDALLLDFVFIAAYGGLFAVWLKSADAAFHALSRYYEPTQPSANTARDQAIQMRRDLLKLFAKLSFVAWIFLAITVIADAIENTLALHAQATAQGFGLWAQAATCTKFFAFFAVLAYCLFTSVVRGLWRIKPRVTLKFEDIAQAERAVIDAGRADLKLASSSETSPLQGLAISGGGIRSATFALGVLQQLAEHKQLDRFDYLSSVSGGGYLAGALHALKFRSNAKGLNETVSLLNSPKLGPDGAAPLSWLRRYGNYLSPSMTAGSGDKVAMYAFVGRNLVLSVGQFCLLLFSLCLLLFAALAKQLQVSPQNLSNLSIQLGAALVLAGFANAVFVFLQQTQVKSLDVRQRFSDSELDRSWSFFQLLLLTLAAVLGSFALKAYVMGGPAINQLYGVPLLPLVVVIYIGSGLLGYLLAWRFKRTVAPTSRQSWLKQAIAGLFAATMGGALGALCIYATAKGFHAASFAGKELIWLVVGPVSLVLSALLAGSLDAALSSRNPLYELGLEYWSRVGGTWFWLMLSVWVMPIACLFFGSYVINWLGSAIPAGVAYLISSGVLLNLAFKAQGSAPNSGLAMRVLMFLAPKLILLGLMFAIAAAVLALAGSQANRVLNFQSFDGYVQSYVALASVVPIKALAGFAFALLGLWALLAWQIPMHKLTLGMMYKHRLVRAYLAASHQARFPDHATNFDLSPKDGDDLPLASLKHRPYPLFNTALNLIRPDHSQLDWQDRKAAPFVLSPLYCGYLPPPSASRRRPVGDVALLSEQAAHLSKELSVGDAVAISGAAANPAMGYHSQPDLAALLALCNVRLGQWVANRAATDAAIENGKMAFSGSYLLREALGDVTDETPFVHLSDGGHFDNMGLFELVRRELALIVVIDGSQDGGFAFADLSSALMKCRVDLGVEIPIDPSALRQKVELSYSETCFVVKDFVYPSGTKAKLIYVKAVRLPDMESELQTYIKQHADFPHQSTGDQFFSETQFEAYRMLGLKAGKLVAEQLVKVP